LLALNIGLVGTGWFSKVHSKILYNFPEVKFKAVCGTSKEKADSFASDFTDVRGYANLTDMLDGENLDAVYISVPPFAHGEIEIALIERGIPFFVEKPLGTNIETPQHILKEIEKKSLITSVGYHFRYMDSTRKLKSLLSDYQVGMVLGQWSGSMPLVPWWRNQEGSGGQLIEQTTHIVDLLRFVCGEVEEVSSYFGNRVMHNQVDSVTVADVGTVNLKLSNGIVANISNTCILPNDYFRAGLTFYTDKGLIDLSHDKLVVNSQLIKEEFENKKNPYELENKAFIHAVLTGDTSGILSDYQDAFRTQQVTYAALESVEKGTPIRIIKK